MTADAPTPAGQPTEAEVEAAARALMLTANNFPPAEVQRLWDVEMSEENRQAYRRSARAALTAARAAAPQSSGREAGQERSLASAVLALADEYEAHAAKADRHADRGLTGAVGDRARAEAFRAYADRLRALVADRAPDGGAGLDERAEVSHYEDLEDLLHARNESGNGVPSLAGVDAKGHHFLAYLTEVGGDDVASGVLFDEPHEPSYEMAGERRCDECGCPQRRWVLEDLDYPVVLATRTPADGEAGRA